MPRYQYACTVPECGHEFEAVQSFSDDALTACPACEGRLRKVFGAVGVVFKGSGFYRTDSRADARGSRGENRPGGAEKSGTDNSSVSDGSGKSSSTSSDGGTKGGDKSGDAKGSAGASSSGGRSSASGSAKVAAASSA